MLRPVVEFDVGPRGERMKGELVKENRHTITAYVPFLKVRTKSEFIGASPGGRTMVHRKRVTYKGFQVIKRHKRKHNVHIYREAPA